MFIINIKEKEKFVGYYCGIFDVKGERLCGYEDNIEDKHIKEYKKRNNAEKVISQLREMYGDVYDFGIEEV